MTSSRSGAIQHITTNGNRGCDVMARGHRFNMMRVVAHFHLNKLPSDGDVHPHPGPFTPVTTDSSTSPLPFVTTGPNSSPSSSLPPIYAPCTRHQAPDQSASSRLVTATTTTTGSFTERGLMGQNTGQHPTTQPIGGSESSERSTLSSSLFINTEVSMANFSLPSQIPHQGAEESGSPVDDMLSSGYEGPWTSTQNPKTVDESNDDEYGEEGLPEKARPTSTSSACLSQGTSMSANPVQTNSDSVNPTMSQTSASTSQVNFSMGPNFDYYANASNSGTESQSGSSAFVFGQSMASNSTMPSTDSIYGACPSGGNTDKAGTDQQTSSIVELSSWNDSITDNDLIKCGEKDECVSDTTKVREETDCANGREKEKEKDTSTHSYQAHTAFTSQTITRDKRKKE